MADESEKDIERLERECAASDGGAAGDQPSPT